MSVISQATPNRVRCVRRGASTQPWGAAPRFARTEPVTDQAVVADARTKLMWQGCAAGQVGPLADCTGTASDYSWQAAMTYCEGLTWGGFADWRLPSRAELASSLDLRANPPIDSTVFPGTPPLFWSSSWADPNPSWGAWRLDLDSVGVGFALLHKGNTYGVRCVRPGP